jgi:hypothetical protein
MFERITPTTTSILDAIVLARYAAPTYAIRMKP